MLSALCDCVTLSILSSPSSLNSPLQWGSSVRQRFSNPATEVTSAATLVSQNRPTERTVSSQVPPRPRVRSRQTIRLSVSARARPSSIRVVSRAFDPVLVSRLACVHTEPRPKLLQVLALLLGLQASLDLSLRNCPRAEVKSSSDVAGCPARQLKSSPSKEARPSNQTLDAGLLVKSSRKYRQFVCK